MMKYINLGADIFWDLITIPRAQTVKQLRIVVPVYFVYVAIWFYILIASFIPLWKYEYPFSVILGWFGTLIVCTIYFTGFIDVFKRYIKVRRGSK